MSKRCYHIRLIRKIPDWTKYKKALGEADLAEIYVPRLIDTEKAPYAEEETINGKKVWTHVFNDNNGKWEDKGITYKWKNLTNNIEVIDLRDFKGTFNIRNAQSGIWIDFPAGKVYSRGNISGDTTNPKKPPDKCDRFRVIQKVAGTNPSGSIYFNRNSTDVRSNNVPACPLVSNPIPVSNTEYVLSSSTFKTKYTFGCNWAGDIGGIIPVQGDACKITIKREGGTDSQATIYPTNDWSSWTSKGHYVPHNHIEGIVYHSKAGNGGQIIWQNDSNFTTGDGTNSDWKNNDNGHIHKIKVEADGDKLCSNAAGLDVISDVCQTWGAESANITNYKTKLTTFCTSTGNVYSAISNSFVSGGNEGPRGNDALLPYTQSDFCIDAAQTGKLNRVTYDSYLTDTYCAVNKDEYPWRSPVCGCDGWLTLEDEKFIAEVAKNKVNNPIMPGCTEACNEADYEPQNIDTCAMTICTQNQNFEFSGHYEDITIEENVQIMNCDDPEAEDAITEFNEAELEAQAANRAAQADNPYVAADPAAAAAADPADTSNSIMWIIICIIYLLLCSSIGAALGLFMMN